MGIKKFELFLESYDRNNYLKWKRKNVTVRGIKQFGEFNNYYSSWGNGLYTSFLSNIKMAKSYGKVYFVLNAIPKNPKVVNTLDEAEIFRQNLIMKFNKENNEELKKQDSISKLDDNDWYDSSFFENNTTMDKEMLKMGYDGFIIKGREIVNYNPPENVMYFEDENELINYYENNL